jgi:hypothetical protein
MKFYRSVVCGKAGVNAAGSKIATLELSCGHVVNKPLRNSEIEGGRAKFKANRVRCRQCRRKE